MKLSLKRHSVLPGFGLSLGYTILYLSLIVLLPLTALVVKTATLTWAEFWAKVTSPQVVASYKITFGASAVAAVVNAFFGLIVAWSLVRYSFPGKKIVDAMVDLPFALPTAVSGIALATIYAPTGWIGQYLEPTGFIGRFLNFCARPLGPAGFVGRHLDAQSSLGAWVHSWSDIHIRTAFSPLGVMIALTFIGLPFVVRTLQPALEDLDAEIEDAAASLGASRWQTFTKVILPSIFPALLTGAALAFARAVGEYGSVIFISGNMPFKTQITSQMIIIKLDEYDYAGATAIAVVMLAASFVFLFLINALQWWTGRHLRAA